MKERREGRVGTVMGLALLAGGTSLAASIGGDHQSLSASLLLGSLALGIGHSLIEEIKRQARRASGSWSRSDSTNAVVLGVAAEAVLLASILVLHAPATRAVGLVLAVAYAAACAYFVTERRRALADAKPHRDAKPAATGDEEHFPTTLELGVISPPSPTSTAVSSDSGQPERSLNQHTPIPADHVDVPSAVPHGSHRAGAGHAATAAHPSTGSASRATTPITANYTAGRTTLRHPSAGHPSEGHASGGSTRPLSPGQVAHAHPASHSHRKSSSPGPLRGSLAAATQPARSVAHAPAGVPDTAEAINVA